MILVRILFAALVVANCVATSAAAQSPRIERVRFPAGNSGAVISDSITGYEAVDYKLQAGAGQRMVVDLATSNLSNYFNVIAPGADAALFVGAQQGTHFDGVLPVAGDYTIQVFLMRNAARRDESADYDLSIHIGAVIAPPEEDFADGRSGGPDFWEVTAGALNIRSAGSASAAVVGRAGHGEVFRNLGCQGSGTDRWCHIETPNGLLSGWVSGLYLVESEGPSAASATLQAEAETAAMGPDFWEVTRVPAGDFLNIRTGPGTTNTIVARAPNGTVLRNLGCRGSGDTRWCHVRTPEGSYDGWVSGAFLVEGQGPAADPDRPGVTIPSGSSLSPTLYVRPTGEVEASWSSGCTVLFDSARQQINAGASCTDGQLRTSQQMVARM